MRQENLFAANVSGKLFALAASVLWNDTAHKEGFMPRARLVVTGALIAICGIFSGDAGALTPEQCTFFAVEDRTAICHATGADERPYILINASQTACAVAHAEHENDFVAVTATNGSLSCSAPNPVPSGAPCDATLACSEGNSCTAGYCSPSGNP